MRFAEIKQATRARLFDLLDQHNDTEFQTQDLVDIAEAVAINQWVKLNRSEIALFESIISGQRLKGQPRQYIPSDTVFYRCSMYKPTYNARVKNFPRIRAKVANWMHIKRANPYQIVGSSDKPFRPDGVFGRLYPGLWKTHLTHDLSTVYRVNGKNVYLFGFYTHDDLGIGTPPNPNKQQALARKFANDSCQPQVSNPTATPRK